MYSNTQTRTVMELYCRANVFSGINHQCILNIEVHFLEIQLRRHVLQWKVSNMVIRYPINRFIIFLTQNVN